MFEKDKWIPAVAFAVFAVAVVGILWGDRIGWDALLYLLPQPVYFLAGMVVLVLLPVFFFRMRAYAPGDPARSLRGSWNVWLFIFGVIGLMLAVWFLRQ